MTMLVNWVVIDLLRILYFFARIFFLFRFLASWTLERQGPELAAADLFFGPTCVCVCVCYANAWELWIVL